MPAQDKYMTFANNASLRKHVTLSQASSRFSIG